MKTLQSKTFSEGLQLKDLDEKLSFISSRCKALQEYTTHHHDPSLPLYLAALPSATQIDYADEIAKPIPIVPVDQHLRVN